MDLDEGVHHVYDWLMGGRDEDPSIRAGSCRSRFFHQLDAGLGMEIVLSGLDEEACRNVVGDALWSRDSICWLAPDRFLSASDTKVATPPGQRLVWFYRSPISIVAEALGGCTPGNLQVELDVWLGRNRAALNLRRQFGRDLLLINADEAPLAELRTELAGVVVPSEGRRGPAEEGRSEEHTSELQSLMRISYAVCCLKKKNKKM